MSRIAIVFTGGTISMRTDARLPAATCPRSTATPSWPWRPTLRDWPTSSRSTGACVSASHLRFAQILDIARLRGQAAGATGDRRRGHRPGHRRDRGDRLRLRPAAGDRQAGGRHRRHARCFGHRLRRAAQPRRRGALRGRPASSQATGVVVVLDGLVVAADDVVKTTRRRSTPSSRATASRLAAWSTSGHLGDVARRRPRRQVCRACPIKSVEDVHLVTVAVGMDGTLLRGVADRAPGGPRRGRHRRRQHAAGRAGRRAELMADGHDRRAHDALSDGARRAHLRHSRVAARRGSARARSCRASTDPSRASRLPLAWRPAWIAPASRSCSANERARRPI